MPKFENLKGKRFGKLVVIEQVENLHTKTRWLCKCDCGNNKIVQSNHLKSGATISCGCYGNKKRTQSVTKHNLSHSRLFNVWCSMRKRCFDTKDANYKNYGGRGITVCKEWLEFLSFYYWAIENGYNKEAPKGQCTLDRINNNGNYEPSNCRWVSNKIQSRNKRNTIFIEYKGKTKSLSEWAEIINIKSQILYKRLKRGWSIEKTMKTPLMVNKYKFKGV